jgi:hypothetical protein
VKGQNVGVDVYLNWLMGLTNGLPEAGKIDKVAMVQAVRWEAYK